MNRIKEIRKEQNLTQSELANLLGVNQSIVQKLETGATDLDIPWMRRLAKALNVSVLELLPKDIITQEEIELLAFVRKKTDDKDSQTQKQSEKNIYKSKQR